MLKTNSPRWTAKARGTFLAALSAGSTVAAATTAAGLSRESAYRLRSRNARFAHAWATALAVARDRHADAWRAAHAARTPAEPFMLRSPVSYRGEVIGHRDTIDATALIRTLARLRARNTRQAAPPKNPTPPPANPQNPVRSAPPVM